MIMNGHGAYWTSTYRNRFGSYSIAVATAFDGDAPDQTREQTDP